MLVRLFQYEKAIRKYRTVKDMIQDLKNGIYHNEYKEQSPVAGDYILFVKGRSVLLKKEQETIEFPHFEVMNEAMAYQYLFQIDINGKMQ